MIFLLHFFIKEGGLFPKGSHSGSTTAYMSHTKFGNKQSQAEIQADQTFIGQPVKPISIP